MLAATAVVDVQWYSIKAQPPQILPLQISSLWQEHLSQDFS